MQDVIVAIKNLKDKYPKLIVIHRPIQTESVTEFENVLQCKIDSELKELYRFSDGLAFMDYVMSSVANKKNFRLFPPSSLNDTRLVFMTCMGKRFLVEIDPNPGRRVWFIDEDTSHRDNSCKFHP